MATAKAVALSVAGWEAALQISEHGDRWEAYQEARAAADATGKPLLNIGCPRLHLGAYNYPCGDVCLDISIERLSVCRSSRPEFGDVRHIPFSDKYFGAAICSHVLEHLATVADAEQALSELERVADTVFVLSPSKLSLPAWIHPEHRLWVNRAADGTISFEQRRWFVNG